MSKFEEAFKLVSLYSYTPVDVPHVDEECFSLDYILKKILKRIVQVINIFSEDIKIAPPEVINGFSDDFLLNTSEINSIKAWIEHVEEKNGNKTNQMELLSILDISIVIYKGILDDNVLENGLNSLNQMDFREWLRKHGATKNALESNFLKMQYDLCVSYINGRY